MGVIKDSVNFLNPGQTPFVVMDQPLYAIGKHIQHVWPEEFGEGKLFIMMGTFHTEKNSLQLLGDWLSGSGWTDALIKAEINTPGVIESYLHVSHLKRTRYSHEVTSVVLYGLLMDAFEISDYTELEDYVEDMKKRTLNSASGTILCS